VNDDWVTVGRIRTAFGVKGWLKLESFTEPASNILQYRDWRLCKGSRTTAIEIDKVDARNDQILVLIKGVDSRESARQLANSQVQVPITELPDLDDEDYYWHQLEGLEVYQFAGNEPGAACTEPAKIGRIKSLLETGANDVLVVQPEPDPGHKGELPEILIPYLPGSVVKDVDLEQGRMLVDWYYD